MIIESSLSCMNLNPISQAIAKPYQTVANSAMLFDASPKWREKPIIHSPKPSLNRPLAPANPGLPIALLLVLSLI